LAAQRDWEQKQRDSGDVEEVNESSSEESTNKSKRGN